MAEVSFRKTVPEDEPYLKEWLSDPEILCWFPMKEQIEVDDAVRLWMHYAKMGASITAVSDQGPCGMAMLYIQPYQKQKHTCLLTIMVKKECRGQGIGKLLLEELSKMAKEEFQIEILHLEVYDGNPARRLYERCGFTPFGRQDRFIKEDGRYNAKILMQKRL